MRTYFVVSVYGREHLLRKYAVAAPDAEAAEKIGRDWAESRGKEVKRVAVKRRTGA